MTTSMNEEALESAMTQGPGWPPGWQTQHGKMPAPRTGAFFEAVGPTATLIRGEGDDAAAAEAAAWVLWQRYESCGEHRFERRSYRNGGGVCASCAMFSANAFAPLEVTDEERASIEELLGGTAGATHAQLVGRVAALNDDDASRVHGELAYAIAEVLAEVWLAEHAITD